MLGSSGALFVVVLACLSISDGQQQHARGFIPPDLLPDTSLYHLVPQGVILLWSGPAHLVPKGWGICDGTQGTPDLRDRFVLGSGPNAQFSVGQKGGASSVTPAVTVRPTRLTIAQMPEHSHGGATSWDGVCAAQPLKASTSAVTTNETLSCGHRHTIDKEGNNEAHTHEAVAAPLNIMPPFHALLYIMKL